MFNLFTFPFLIWHTKEQGERGAGRGKENGGILIRSVRISTIGLTTRKPEKSNGITDGNIPSVINTDGHNSVSKSIGIYQRNHSVGNAVGIYRQNISVGIYRRLHRRNIHFVWKYATAW